MIKVISFDIGGTLLDSAKDKSNNYNLKELTKIVGLSYDSVRDAYKYVFQKTKGNLNELIDRFCNILKIDRENNIVNFFSNKFANNAINNAISKDNISLINNLKENGYKIILFSNSCCLINNDAIKQINNLVDGVFYSYDIGFTKDDKESYDYIEKKLKVTPNEILHIGDTFKSDYVKPIENGWNALFYGNSDDENVKSISSLNEIIDYLESKQIIK